MPAAPKPYRPPNRGPTRAYRTRGTSKQRGYQDGWPELRNRYLADHPFCEDCPPPESALPASYYVEVDHVIPFHGMSDPLRLDERNLRTRCAHHHRLKTHRYDGETRATYERRLLALGYDRALADTLGQYRETVSERRTERKDG